MVGNIYQDAESVAGLQARVIAIPADPVTVRVNPPFWADAVHDPSLADGAWTPMITIDAIPGGVSFLGDSVSLGADRLLRENIPDLYIDSEISRLLEMGREILLEWQEDGSLREYVVIALGTNDGDENFKWKGDVDGMLEELPAGCRVVFVTPYIGKPDPGISEKEIAAYYRELAQALPYVTVADWAEAIEPYPDLLASDKTHLLGNKAAQLFADVVLMGIDEAGRKEGK